MPNDETHDHILPGAFGDKPKTVPLVVYEKDGTRKVVGKATITTDEGGLHLAGNVTDPDMQKFVKETVGFGAAANPKKGSSDGGH